ncbi:MAG: 5-formyltetrahydrofolate cyclo-ligase [Desulfobulbaceae bacterium]|nr:5-formyltetrahydrofolate cyclo-ligase [Desulfobulbaceae bacterium]
MPDPSAVRKDILSARNQLTSNEISLRSEAIHARLLAMEQIQKRQHIFAYVSFRSEVETLLLIGQLLQLGKTVTVPITRVKEKRLDAIHITDLTADLEPGYCNIPEPKEELCESRLVAPETIETILLPGSVFDERGGRFGYGGGFYDRFVSKIPNTSRIGLAYDLQIIKKAPLQPHDELLDFVVTESRIINGERKLRTGKR